MDVQETPAAHACFQLDADSSLTVPAGISDYKAWHYLSHRILEKHYDLHNHTKRVSLCHKITMHEFLPGALHDLFIALGSLGYELRTRIFIASQTCMTPEHIEFFQTWLIEQSQPASDISMFPGALLSTASGDKAPGDRLIAISELQLESCQLEQRVEQLMTTGNLPAAKSLLDSADDTDVSPALKGQLREQIVQEEKTMLALQILSNQLGYTSQTIPGSMIVSDYTLVMTRG